MTELSRERWRATSELFFSALDRPLGERAEFVERTAGGDEELRNSVLSLLEAAEGAESLLDLPDHLFARLMADGPILDPPRSEVAGVMETGAEGEVVGPYRLERVIGRGGIGTVYLAERIDGAYRGEVAIKLLRRGLDTDDILDRFRVERQILASLNHPNIARMLDGGATDDGRPYLVMERVEGRPIRDYCDAHRMAIDDRLRLFTVVCRAVQYAHRNLIVHRDLKPSNIFVSDDGQVKLLDFGIAKLLGDPSAAESGTHTRTGVRVMTPGYASPEQVRGEPVTTASDVYQLGILLCELVSGHKPYEAESRAPIDVEEAILNRDPLPPSTLAGLPASYGSATAHTIAEQRGSDVRRLQAQLRGDLDTIALKALRKEPERRYLSAGELEEDVERYLQGRPVLARPDTWQYRSRKFIARHPASAAIALIALVVALSYVGTLRAHAVGLERERNIAHEAQFDAEDARGRSVLEWERAERERFRAETEREGAEQARVSAEEERDRAEAERLRAELALRQAETEGRRTQQISDFLVGLFRSSDPLASDGAVLTAREILDRGVAQADELESQPEVQAAMLAVLGRVHGSLGLFEDGEALLRRAIPGFGTGQAERMERERARAGLAYAIFRQGRLEEARETYLAALDALPPTTEDAAHAMQGLGMVELDLGHPAEARRHLREAIRTYERAGSDPLYIAQARTGLANVEILAGEFDEAERLLLRSVEEARSSPQRSEAELLDARSTLGNLYRVTGRYAASAEVLGEVAAEYERILGPDHLRVASALNDHGLALQLQGRNEEAEALIRRSLDINRTPSPGTSMVLNNLGLALRGQGRYEEAISAISESLEMKIGVLGRTHPSTASSKFNLGSILHENGRYDDALPLLERVVEIDRDALGEDHPEVGIGLSKLAIVRRDRGDHAEAERLFHQALAILRERFHPEHPRISEALIGLGGLFVLTGRPAEADVLLREALDIHRAALHEGHWLTAEAKSWLGASLAARHRYDEAEAILVEAHRTLLEVRPPGDRYTRLAGERIAEMHRVREAARTTDDRNDRR